jgi:hypothetical protein
MSAAPGHLQVQPDQDRTADEVRGIATQSENATAAHNDVNTAAADQLESTLASVSVAQSSSLFHISGIENLSRFRSRAV